MKKVILYFSNRSHIELGRKYAASNGYEIVEFIDCSRMSPVIHSSGIKKGQVDIALFYDIPDLRIKASALPTFIENLKSKGVKVFSISMNLELTSPMGNAICCSLCSMAESESRRRSESIKRGIRLARERRKGESNPIRSFSN